MCANNGASISWWVLVGPCVFSLDPGNDMSYQNIRTLEEIFALYGNAEDLGRRRLQGFLVGLVNGETSPEERNVLRVSFVLGRPAGFELTRYCFSREWWTLVGSVV